VTCTPTTEMGVASCRAVRAIASQSEYMRRVDYRRKSLMSPRKRGSAMFSTLGTYCVASDYPMDASVCIVPGREREKTRRGHPGAGGAEWPCEWPSRQRQLRRNQFRIPGPVSLRNPEPSTKRPRTSLALPQLRMMCLHRLRTLRVVVSSAEA
jgi:hypothetical protein